MIALTDSVVRDVLIGVVGNGLWSLVVRSGATITKEVRGVVSPPEPTVLKAVRTAADELLESLPDGQERARGRLVGYLKSPELESIVRQLFATSLVGTTKESTTSTIKAEFVSALSMHLDVGESRLEPFATSFFATLVSSVEGALQAAIEKNILPAHEAKSAARHRMLLDEISNLKKNLAFLNSEPSLNIDSILKFEAEYRGMVGSVHSHIKPPHLESGRRVPIDEIFVAPLISYVPRLKAEQPETLPLPVFLSRLYRAVLLGNPGGGKSTVSAKICYDLATRYEDRLFAGREITPVVVTLREYGTQKKATNCSIVQFLAQQASSRYQLEPPPSAFEYLLLNGRLVVIFDGLDELLDTNYRQEITSNVETFCKLYPSVPVLVTSREVGYEQAPLNEKTFGLFRLAPFDEDRVREYAEKWFARDEDYTREQKKQKAEAFFTDSAFVPDLRSNPLMLGLMCNLYRAEGYIPRNRPEVYGKCSVMLFERWDKSRDIVVPLPFEEHIRPAMQDLAFWIYSNEELQGGVSEHRLIDRTSEYLCKWVFDDVYKARAAATDFIRFCTGRAWVFTDTGTTREGEGLFQFTHRTFLEYFTACYLVSVHPTPQPLMDALRLRVMKGEWDVVVQLSFQIQSKQVQGAADELLGTLLQVRSASQSAVGNVLAFAERSLEFLVPSPKTRREIARAALEFWLRHARRDASEGADEHRAPGRVTEHIGNLLMVASENRDTVADEIQTFLTQGVLSDDKLTSTSAAELGLDLTHPLHSIEHRRQAPKEVRDFWLEVSARIVEATRDRILSIARNAPTVALRCCRKGLIPLSSATEDLGIAFLVTSAYSAALGGVWFYPPAYSLVESALGLWHREESQEQRERLAADLASLSPILLRTPTPWVPRGRFAMGYPERLLGDYPDWPSWRHKERAEQPAPESPDAIFALLCFLGIEVEAIGKSGPMAPFVERGGPIPESLRRVLLGRISAESKEDAVHSVQELTFSPEQREFILRWINREIDFVATRSHPAQLQQAKRPRRRASQRAK